MKTTFLTWLRGIEAKGEAAIVWAKDHKIEIACIVGAIIVLMVTRG